MVFRKHIYPGILTCERCNEELLREEFIVDSELPFVCKSCITDSEIGQFIRPQLSKDMDRLKTYEKILIIRKVMMDREVIVRVKGSIHK